MSQRDPRTNILDAAKILFAEKGFSGASVREIANKAGVNLAMIHYYFGNKDGLYRTLLEVEIGKVREMALDASAIEGTASAKIERFVANYARFLATNPNFARIAQQEMLNGGDLFLSIFRPQIGKNYATLQNILKEGIANGEFRPIDIDLGPFSLIGMIVFVFVARPVVEGVLGVDASDEEFADRLARHTVDLYVRGIVREHPT